ncbi:MAG: hypothetical protein IJ402_03745 [Bacteroidales bacterium]|nr:hypothetical protein [Bacteroidales bacterium]
MESEINRIRLLCDKYFEGETTTVEEQAIREYFARARDIPDDMKSVRTMMCGFAQAASMTYEGATAVSRNKGIIPKVIWGSVAAAASIALCITLSNKETYGYDADGNAITDPETALADASFLAGLDRLETTIDIAEILTKELENN